jgi:hypothetical protein
MQVGDAVEHKTFGCGVIRDAANAGHVQVRFTAGDKVILREYLTAVSHNHTTEALGCAGKMVATERVSVEKFVHFLEMAGYFIQALAHAPGDSQRCLQEYRTWTEGVELPEHCLREYPSYGRGFGREWEVACMYSDDMPCHIPVVEGGSIGKGHTTSQPHGLKYGHMVRFRHTEVVMELVRAGLRAR